METINKEALKKVLKSKINRQLLYYLDLCARCSICKDACHQYTVTKDVLYLPAYRAELIRRIYKKYHSPLGRLFPKFYEGREIDDEKLLRGKGATRRELFGQQIKHQHNKQAHDRVEEQGLKGEVEWRRHPLACVSKPVCVGNDQDEANNNSSKSDSRRSSLCSILHYSP